MKNNKVYISHIIDAIERIKTYTAGVDFKDFEKNEMMVSAVVRELEVIGEAANQVDDAYKKEHADLPWKEMVGMRNFLIHEYFGVSKKIVWNTIKNNIPSLKKIIETIK